LEFMSIMSNGGCIGYLAKNKIAKVWNIKTKFSTLTATTIIIAAAAVVVISTAHAVSTPNSAGANSFFS